MIYHTESEYYRVFLIYRPDIRAFARKHGLPSPGFACSDPACGAPIDGSEVKKCMRCATVYCSRQCQHADYPRHKQGLCGQLRADNITADIQWRRYLSKAGSLLLHAVDHLPALRHWTTQLAVSSYNTHGRGMVMFVFEVVDDVFRFIDKWSGTRRCSNGNRDGVAFSLPGHCIYRTLDEHAQLESYYSAQRTMEFLQRYDPSCQFVLFIGICHVVNGVLSLQASTGVELLGILDIMV